MTLRGAEEMPNQPHATEPGCRFCSGLATPKAEEYWNRPLLRSPNFLVVPSIGALVEGWVLVVPTAHYVSAATISAGLRTEFKSVVGAARQLVGEVYGPSWVFEHGPKTVGRQVGCGIDHAHMHVVPTRLDLVSAAKPLLPKVAFRRVGGLDTLDASIAANDYLFAESPNGEAHLASGDGIGSQVFRRAIADGLGVSERYNWREYPQLETVKATIARLGGFNSEVEGRTVVAA
jgi:diadenosine tetraphosphate (Ap4A) HIT family hydrolase